VDHYISTQFCSCLAVYTDGSKDPMNGKTGECVFILEFDVNICKRLTNDVPVYYMKWR
jgi:hypothetical protein